MAVNRSLRQPFASVLLDGVVAVFCVAVVYTIITSFERPASSYHDNIAQSLIYWTSLAALVYLLAFGRNLVWRADLTVPWLALASCIVISVLLSENHGAALARAQLYYAIFIFGLVLWAWFHATGKTIVPLVLIAIGLLHIVILMLVMMAMQNFDPEKLGDHRWIPYHSNIRHVAYHGMVAACAGLTVGLLESRLRLLGFAIAAMSLGGIVYFGSRGALLGWIIFAVMACVLLPRRAANAGICAAVLGLGFLGATFADQYWFQAPLAGTITHRADSIAAVAHTSGRTQIWFDAIATTTNHPLFGFGPEGYLMSHCCLLGTLQPHNSVVQFLIEIGVIGLVAIAWLLWRTLGRDALVFWRLSGTDRLDAERALLFAMIVGIMVFSLVDGLFYHVVPLTLFSIIAALYASRESTQAGADGTSD